MKNVISKDHHSDSGKTALVTGASSGIGRAASLHLAYEGIQVALVGRNRENLLKTADDIYEIGGQCEIIQADLAEEQEIGRTVEHTVEKFGRLDILVNSAGIIGSGSIENTSSEQWDSMLQINLKSVFLMIKCAIPHLEKTKGAVVNVSSVTGLRSFPNMISYCVSKAGVDQLTRCAALELAPKGIRINAVNPGVIRTELHMRGGMDEQAYSEFLERCKDTHPLGRAGEPEEAAELIAFLATERSGWITGACIPIDGGRAQTCAR